MENIENKFPLHRLHALIDGVYAIVITLLVLDLKVPADVQALKDLNIDQFLTGHFQDIFVFMLSFLVLASLWLTHHNEFHYLQHTDHNHLWLNIVTLMFVSLVPFSSALVSKFPGDWLTELFLGTNMFIISALYYVTWVYATTHHRLVSPDLSHHTIVATRKKFLIVPISALLSMAAAFIIPLFAAYILLLAPIALFFMKITAKKTDDRQATTCR